MVELVQYKGKFEFSDETKDVYTYILRVHVKLNAPVCVRVVCCQGRRIRDDLTFSDARPALPYSSKPVAGFQRRQRKRQPHSSCNSAPTPNW